jgi:hypothetical protein
VSSWMTQWLLKRVDQLRARILKLPGSFKYLRAGYQQGHRQDCDGEHESDQGYHQKYSDSGRDTRIGLDVNGYK